MSRLALLVLLLLAPGICGQALADTYYFSSPPRLNREESESLYTPLLQMLNRSSGESFVYVHPDSWFVYENDMQKGRFDLILDDAHFASWRIALLGHIPLARIEPDVRYVVLANRTGWVYSKEDLIAHSLCAFPPPDLGAVSILQKFEAPFQIPQILATRDPMERVRRLLAGQCAAAILPRRYYSRSVEIRAMAHRLKIITQSDPYPGLTFTSSRNISPELANTIKGVLLSREGARATSKLRNRLADGGDFVEAGIAEYQGLDALLKDYPGFNH